MSFQLVAMDCKHCKMDDITQYQLNAAETPQRPLGGIIPFARASRGLFTQNTEDAFVTWTAPVPTPLTDFGGAFRQKTVQKPLILLQNSGKLSDDGGMITEEAGSQSETGSEVYERREHLISPEVFQDSPRQKIRLKNPEDRKLVKTASWQVKMSNKLSEKERPQSSKRIPEVQKFTTAVMRSELVDPTRKLRIPSQVRLQSSSDIRKEKLMSLQKLEELRRPAIQLRASGLKTALMQSLEPMKDDAPSTTGSFSPITSFTPRATGTLEWRDVQEETEILPRKAVPVRSQKPERVPSGFKMYSY